jgi:hypothetical protein
LQGVAVDVLALARKVEKAVCDFDIVLNVKCDRAWRVTRQQHTSFFPSRRSA